MNRNIRAASLSAITVAALLGLNVHAHAQVVYSDTFDSGTSMGAAGPGFNETNLNDGVVSKSIGGISADVSGSGYFLFENTNIDPIPPTSLVYVSPAFAVTANTNYNLSFYLTNQNNIANASIQAQINGIAIGLPVSAVGIYATNGWQQFNFAFNSGAATTATLSLRDLVLTGIGNDFGVDNVRVGAVPEPSSVALLVGMGVSGSVFVRRRVKVRKAA